MVGSDFDLQDGIHSHHQPSIPLDINQKRAMAEAVFRHGQDFIDLLHDKDGSKRGTPAFLDARLAHARTLIEEAVFLAGGSAGRLRE